MNNTKTIFILSSLALLLASCRDTQPADSATLATENTEAIRSAEGIAGRYEGTLPCTDCRGIKTMLILNPDSTYRLDQEYLGKTGDSAHKIEYGRYVAFEQFLRIQLKYRDGGLGPFIGITDLNTVTMQDADGRDISGSTLQRTHRLITQKNGYKLYYSYVSDTSMKYVTVFRKEPRGDVIINKAFLDKANDAQRAIMAYYCKVYNTSCNNGVCDFSEAMSLNDEAAIDAAISKALSIDSVSIAADQSLKLVSLHISLAGQDGYGITTSVLNEAGMIIQGSDSYLITDGKASLTHHSSREVKPQMQYPAGTNKQMPKPGINPPPGMAPPTAAKPK